MAEVVAPIARAAATQNTPLVPDAPSAGGPKLKRGTSHLDLERNEGLNPQKIKAQFIFKVYGILAGQLALTTLCISAFCFHEPTQKFGVAMASTWWFPWAMIAVLIPTLCAMQFKKHEYPTNFSLLMFFTTIMSVYLGSICGMFMLAGKGFAILTAAGCTFLIFGCLSAYVWYSDTDFSFLGGFLFVALLANMFLGLFAYAFGWALMTWLYHVMGVLIFSGYILYDTDQIVNKVELEDCDTGTAIWGATELYLDLVNLFLHLLALFGNRD